MAWDAAPLPPAASPKRIIIAKVDRMHSDALNWVCTQAFPGASIQICCNACDALALLRLTHACMLILGLSFPDMEGSDLLRIATREKLATRIVVVSQRSDEHLLLALRHLCFDGFIDSTSESIGTVQAIIRQIAAGHGYISPGIRHRLLNRKCAGVLQERLTPTEIQVLRMIGDGSDNDEAATLLGMRAATVQTHRRNIMRKLDICSSAKLVREAVRLGVVRISPEGQVFRPGLMPPAPNLATDRRRRPRAAVINSKLGNHETTRIGADTLC